ncbi:MAG: YaeQ family protein [Myxococcales bacterium]|nr:YaeQ family protein [Myxococcales bacterium]
MASGSTLYRVAMELCDVDRGVYETLDFRVAQHPSEGEPRLIARMLAYGLLFEEGLKFSKGLSSSEEPALWTHDLTGQLLHWIDVGTPSADRIHLASKRAERVSIVSHLGVEALRRETQRRLIHRAEVVRVLLVDPELVRALALSLARNSEWTLVRNEGSLNISLGGQDFSGALRELPLPI